MTSKINCNSEEILQQHLFSIAPAVLSHALDLDSSAISRIRSGERGLKFSEFAKIIHLPSNTYPDGLSIAGGNEMHVSRDELLALVALSKKFLNTIKPEEM